MYFPILNSSSSNPKPTVKNEINEDNTNCDKYNDIFNQIYKGMSVETKYKLMYNMDTKELETFKQCQIKWLKENTNS